jgi:hypothetical protein
MPSIRKSPRLMLADLKIQVDSLERAESAATELLKQNKRREDGKVKEYVNKVVRLGKVDFAIRYGTKLLYSLTIAKEKARLQKEADS